jgi:hypothetical protein
MSVTREEVQKPEWVTGRKSEEDGGLADADLSIAKEDVQRMFRVLQALTPQVKHYIDWHDSEQIWFVLLTAQLALGKVLESWLRGNPPSEIVSGCGQVQENMANAIVSILRLAEHWQIEDLGRIVHERIEVGAQRMF